MVVRRGDGIRRWESGDGEGKRRQETGRRGGEMGGGGKARGVGRRIVLFLVGLTATVFT